MSDLTPRALAILRAQHGHASTAQLDKSGVPRRARRRLIASGLLVPVQKAVVRIASAPETLEGRCIALCLAHPTGFITGPTGGKLVGLRRMPRAQPIHFSVRHGIHLDPQPDVILHQTTSIRPLDVRQRRDGIRIASPARLAFDLAASLSPADHASVIEQLLHEGRCSMAELAAVARRLCHPRRRGSLRFFRSLVERGDRPAAESHPEIVLADALRARNVPVVPQHSDLRLPNGTSIRIDLAVPAVRWAVEIDVHPDHLLLEGTVRDKRRDRQCHLIGWQVERVTEVDLIDIPGLVDELVALYEARIAAAA
ncbi:MAG: type IV toxin-antitoxin system AbiEi family antitoxin domain-containing protein [Actinomycetota bacterium]|nr:type IV toxin-antitoxin system AbiEi family antitoxin domain-containing protein [Actinomycetota bacterium]